MLDLGADQQLRDLRQFIQDALEPVLRSLVEQALGRGTRAVIAGFDARRATAVHVIMLDPAGPDDGARLLSSCGNAAR